MVPKVVGSIPISHPTKETVFRLKGGFVFYIQDVTITRKQAVEIIKKEGLQRYNVNENRYDTNNETVIKEKAGKWLVYATDERAGVYGIIHEYNTEDDALDMFIDLLRFANRK